MLKGKPKHSKSHEQLGSNMPPNMRGGEGGIQGGEVGRADFFHSYLKTPS